MKNTYFAERLKKTRKANNLTQVKLASLLNIAKQTYSGYENSVSSPDLQTLSNIADILCVTTDYLLGNSDISLPKQINVDNPIINEKFQIAEKILELDIDQARAIDSIIKQMKK